MTDLEKDNILYRPDLEPGRRYRSDGDFEHKSPGPYLPDKEDTTERDTTPKEVWDDLQEISEVLNSAPPEIRFLQKSIKKMQDRIVVAFPEGIKEGEPEAEYESAEADKKNDITILTPETRRIQNSITGLPSIFPKPLNIKIQTEKPKTLVQIIRGHYDSDQLQLDKYYIQKLQTVLQRYFQQMFTALADSGLTSIEDLTRDFDGDEVVVPSGQGLEHCRDFICRSQVMRNQKSRLFKKTHSVDKTLKHIRAWHAAEAQRERYYSEKYKDSGSYTESHSNALLRESRSSYDKAYEIAVYNMYKYLNSSVMLVADILDDTIKEAQAKSMLLKAGVNIFAFDTSAYFSEFGGIAGNSGQASGSEYSLSKETTTESSDVSKKSQDLVGSAISKSGGGFGGGI